MYRKALFILFWFGAAFLVAGYVFDRSPSSIGRYLLAQVGLSASAPPNQFNTLAQQLENRRQDLDAREQSLKQREAAFADAQRKEINTTLPYVVAGMCILLFLILLNYYLDWQKRRVTERVSVHKIEEPKGAPHVFRIR